jgi:hypothetical protein
MLAISVTGGIDSQNLSCGISLTALEISTHSHGHLQGLGLRFEDFGVMEAPQQPTRPSSPPQRYVAQLEKDHGHFQW